MLTENIVLFAHLIPCCQNYEFDENGNLEVLAFERFVNVHCLPLFNHAKFDEFVGYLLHHAANRVPSIHQLNSTTQYVYLLPPAHCAHPIRWEEILWRIRNIFSHESSPEWSNIQELATRTFQFFGSRLMFSTIIRLYSHFVLNPSK